MRAPSPPTGHAAAFVAAAGHEGTIAATTSYAAAIVAAADQQGAIAATTSYAAPVTAACSGTSCAATAQLTTKMRACRR